MKRTDAEAEAPILWFPDAKSQLIGKDPDTEKDWRQKEKGMTGWDSWMASWTQWTWLWVNSDEAAILEKLMNTYEKTDLEGTDTSGRTFSLDIIAWYKVMEGSGTEKGKK